MTSDGEFSNFIIDKDEKAVGSGTEPPGYPVGDKCWSAGRDGRGRGGQVQRADAENSAQNRASHQRPEG